VTDKELMQQALEALEIESKGYADKVTRNRPVITALRERLAQPMYMDLQHATEWASSPAGQIVLDELEKRFAPLVTAPQPREWVGLTEEEIKALPQWFPSYETAAVMPLIRAIEAKLKERNT
jgi:hypothetical protein